MVKFETKVYHDFFVIEKSNDEPIGFAFTYDFNLTNGCCKFTLNIYRKYQDTGLGAFASICFMRHLFRLYPIRQLFISVYDYNKKCLSATQKGGFEEVGRLPEYRFWDGYYHDLHILRLTREKFNDLYSNYYQ